MKTINYKGNTYQIGATYEFSDDGICWVPDTFSGINESRDSKFESHISYYEYIRVCQLPIGTITAEPIELIDGKAYQFDYHSGKGVHGIYSKPNVDGFAIFSFVGGSINKELVTKIQPLTVEIK